MIFRYRNIVEARPTLDDCFGPRVQHSEIKKHVRIKRQGSADVNAEARQALPPSHGLFSTYHSVTHLCCISKAFYVSTVERFMALFSRHSP